MTCNNYKKKKMQCQKTVVPEHSQIHFIYTFSMAVSTTNRDLNMNGQRPIWSTEKPASKGYVL